MHDRGALGFVADLMNNHTGHTLHRPLPYLAFQQFMAAIDEKPSAIIH